MNGDACGRDDNVEGQINSFVSVFMHGPVREAVSYRGLFTAGWFGVREKHCSRLEIYYRLRTSEQAEKMNYNAA